MDESLKAVRAGVGGGLNHNEIAVENVVLSDVQARPFFNLSESIVETMVLGAWARRLSTCVRMISIRHV